MIGQHAERLHVRIGFWSRPSDRGGENYVRCPIPAGLKTITRTGKPVGARASLPPLTAFQVPSRRYPAKGKVGLAYLQGITL